MRALALTAGALAVAVIWLTAKTAEEARLRNDLRLAQSAATTAAGERDRFKERLSAERARATQSITEAEARGRQAGRDECADRKLIESLPRSPDGRRIITPEQLRRLGPRDPAP